MGGSDICMDQTRRACGGRLMAVRAVCADAGEDMPELAQKETRCASAPWLPFGGRSSRGDVSRNAGPHAHLRDDLRRAACSGCRVLLERDLLGVAVLWAITWGFRAGRVRLECDGSVASGTCLGLGGRWF